ncbi:glycoside hydrolase family 28 protein [Parabacteroides sp. OttesenSCG-928-G06]|nr:glycoside hydrolase family 28 protein [Parabacteroides sp. OttesenSCG-928-G06]
MKQNHILKVLFTLISGVAVAGCQPGTTPADRDTDAAYYKNIPFPMEEIARPQFPDYRQNIVSNGAIGDGITDNTEAINKTIREVAAKGGGTVVIPAGIWKSGAIELLSNIHLYTEDNALVIFDPNPKAYPIIDTSFEGLNTRRATSPLHATNATNIAITGHGVFDGSGDSWRFVKKDKMTESQWKRLIASGGVLNAKGDTWYPSEESQRGHTVSDSFNNPQHLQTDEEWQAIHHWLRPVMVSIRYSKQILLEGVTFRNSPAWGIHPLCCEDIILSNLKIFNPWYSQNGDGLDLESCKNALIVDNLFDVGDDAICLKSGKDKDGRERNVPCENVIIRNNTVLHGHGGFVVGSEMSGGVRNIFVADCMFLGTDVGLRFKSTRGRGGVVENIWIENINMCNIPTEPLLFDLFYGGKSAVEELEEGKTIWEETVPVTEETPAFRNINIRNIQCAGARRAMYFNGLPEMKIKDVNVENVVITSQLGAELVHTEGANFKNIKIITQQGPKLTVKKSKSITFEGKSITESEETIIID